MDRADKFLKSAVLGAVLLFAASNANANLLVNGSFENPDIATGTWKVFNSAEVPGWEGNGIEVWDTFNGVSATDGTQFVELNANTPFYLSQSFATETGQLYDLSFDYRARINNDEAFLVSIEGIDSWLVSDHIVSQWLTFENSFVAVGAMTTLTFTVVVPETGTMGNLVDNVKVTAAVSVPEPSSLALLGLCLVGLGFSRRRQR